MLNWPSAIQKPQMGQSSANRKDFELKLTKEWVKQGRSFTSILESSEKYGRSSVYWKISGNGITEKDLEDRKLKGTGTLKKKGIYKHTFGLARNSERSENTTLSVAYYFDKEHKNLIASENIELIAREYDPDDDPDEPWKLTATRIDNIKENVAVRAQISNGKPGQKIYFQLTGDGLDKNDLDLSYARMSGTAEMDEDGYAVIPFMIRADHKTEGTETFDFSFYKDKSYKKKYSSFSLNILDESVETPENSPTASPIHPNKQPLWSGPKDEGTWFTIAPSRTAIQENQSSRTRINSDSKIGNTLYFKIAGDGIDKNDFDLNYARTTGKIKINNSGTAFIPQLLRNDNKTEGTENMTISLYRDKNYKKLVATSTVPILDTSIETPGNPPILSTIPSTEQPQWGGGVDGGSWYTLSPGRAEYKRGDEIGVRIDSDSLPGTKLVWQVSGAGVSADDIEPSKNHSGLSGKETIGLNGIGQFNLTFKADNLTKDNTEITFDLFYEKGGKKKLATTSLVLAATPAEAIPNKVEIDEGKEMKFKVFTRGMREGETVYWDVSGSNITNGDFDTPISGSTTLDSTRKFQVRLGASKDLLTEGTESFRFNMYTDEAKNNPIGSSEDVSIFDTSTTPIKMYDVAPNSDLVQQGKGFQIKIKTKNIGTDEIIHWAGSGSAADQNIVELEGSDSMYGTVPLDLKGNAEFQFRTNTSEMTSASMPFNFTLFESSDLLEPLSTPIEVTILER